MANKTHLDIEQIIKIAAQAALSSYGVVSIADKDAIKGQSQRTKKGKMEEGVFVKRKSDNTFALDIYLVLAQGIKITETLHECQKCVKFNLEKKYPKMCREVNVYVVKTFTN